MRQARWIVCAALLGLALGCATAAVVPESDVAPAPADDTPVDRVIEITAERFVFTPSEIRLTIGETVRFELSSGDTDHGFRVTGTDIDVTIPKRRQGTARVVFEATAPGDYRFECSRLCGAGHGYMRGVIRVVAASPTAGGSEDGS